MSHDDRGTAAASEIPDTLSNRSTAIGLSLVRRLSRRPLPVLRRWGGLAGVLVYWLVARRRRIAHINLRLCFPDLSETERSLIVREHFRCFMRSVFDRFILWHQPAERIRRFVRLEGEEHLARIGNAPMILLAPHFVGLDAGGTRISLDRRLATMFARQKNPVVNEEMRAGRSRFNDAVLISRLSGLRGAIRLIRQGVPFYFLPDMDLGARDAVWVPFFGVSAATVTSVARLVQMTDARVVPCVTQMTEDGYVTRLYPAWEDFPGEDIEIATRRMNEFIEDRVREMPAQYLWSHKRFKTRPPGEPGYYDDIHSSRFMHRLRRRRSARAGSSNNAMPAPRPVNIDAGPANSVLESRR